MIEPWRGAFGQEMEASSSREGAPGQSAQSFKIEQNMTGGVSVQWYRSLGTFGAKEPCINDQNCQPKP